MAAASDLKFLLDEVVRRLASDPVPIRLQPVYGSSGSFHAQLQQRAPFDVFLAADIEYPRDLVRRGIGRAADLFTYARGRLVLWVGSPSPLRIEQEGLRALLEARRVAMANPRHAPYGRAAEAALRTAGLWDALRPRLVFGDNAAQAAHFAQSGAADAALIARSLAAAPAMRAAGRFVELPPGTYPALWQAGLILPWARSRAGAERLRDYLAGSEGRRLLAEYGFDVPRSVLPTPGRSTGPGLPAAR